MIMVEASRPLLVLVDGTNLLWRAAYGFPARVMTRDSRDVTAPFGFFALLRKALRELECPAECLVIFDSETGWVGRQERYAAYKRHRLELDCAPLVWLPDIQQGLTGLGISWQESGDWEADDVIATIASRTRTREVLIMSTDRDFHQLLGPRVSQLNTARSTRRIVTDLDVRERYLIAPGQWCDYVAMVGDRSDGIPGIRGIGRVRAAELLAGGLQLEDLPHSGRLDSHHGRRLGDQFEQALCWRDLVRLRTRVRPVLATRRRTTPELPLAAAVVERLGIW
jgi:DNA polymerase-1